MSPLSRPALQAASITLKLASPIFKLAMETSLVGNSLSAEQELAFENWYFLRSLANDCFNTGELALTPAKREKMLRALDFVHDHSHPADVPTCPANECTCQTALTIQGLNLLAADADGVPFGEGRRV